MKRLLFAALLAAVSCSTPYQEASPPKRIVLVAGKASHGPGEHEFRAGCLLLKKCLDRAGGVEAFVSDGWPTNGAVLENADAIVLYMDGGTGHPALQPGRLQTLERLMKKGVGLGCVHYAVEVPKEKGGPEFLRWLGGYFETYWSVNPTWEANFPRLPAHPMTRGVAPFKIRDEWYYHMRFAPKMEGVTPILTALPPESTRGRAGQPESHGGNPEVQAHRGEPEHTAWAFERPGGGRSFGFTGGHFHKNWENENFRKIVLNGVLWIAGADVPTNGVSSKVSTEDLKKDMDPKPKK